MRFASVIAVVVVAAGGVGTMSDAKAGTARATMTVSATILPSPCSAENKDPNCIPTTQTATTSTRTYTVAVAPADPNSAPTTRTTEATVTTVTISY
jgi:predicted Rossmann-fold nucleotide-binding protein